jgi:2-aminoethylphosphonate-pyruvate transaminase
LVRWRLTPAKPALMRLIAASGKCLEGVPGMGFVFIRKAVLDACAGQSQSLAMDLHDQYVYMEKTGQWRFTPPTHVVVALHEAIAQFEAEGGSARTAGALHTQL